VITIELYLTRKEVMALKAKGMTDKEIGRQLEVVPSLIPQILSKEVFVDFRLSSTSPKKGDDFGALLKSLVPEERDRQLRELVYCRVKKMGYHFSQKRLDQLYDTALRNAE
jgi:hypothetical protein